MTSPIFEEPGTPLAHLAISSTVPAMKWKFVGGKHRLLIDGIDYMIHLGKIHQKHNFVISGLAVRDWVFGLESIYNKSGNEIHLFGYKDNFYGIFHIYSSEQLERIEKSFRYNKADEIKYWRKQLNCFVAEHVLTLLYPEYSLKLVPGEYPIRIKPVDLTVRLSGGITTEKERAAYLKQLRNFRGQSSQTADRTSLISYYVSNQPSAPVQSNELSWQYHFFQA